MNLPPFNLLEVAQATNGTLHGDGKKMLTGIAPIESAGSNELSFFAPKTRHASQELLQAARKSRAGAILIARFDEAINCPQVVVPNPLAAIITLANLFYSPPRPPAGIDPLASVAPGAKIGENVAIAAFSVIGSGAKIGDDSIIFPHVVIYPGAEIGRNCVIHAGAVVREFCVVGDDCHIQNGVVVGGDGFGYMPDPELGHRRIPHIGAVKLENGVDLGANATVDRGMLGNTRVGLGSKIDNLVMVGHNVQIGERVLLCAQTGISGSSSIGDDTVLGGSVGVADHVSIGKRVRAAARSGITGSVPENTDVAGYPHQEASLWRRAQVLVRRLPELLASLRAAESRIKSLEDRLSGKDSADASERRTH